MTTSRHRSAPDRERGSLSVLMVVVSTAILLIIGLAVDGGAKVQATQRANAIADEAARAGGQLINRGELLSGGPATVDPTAAIAAAQDYLSRNSVPGTVTVTDADTLQVSVTITEDTVFLGLIGITTMTVQGSGSADLVPD